MNNSNLTKWTVELIAALLILLFVYTACSKLLAFGNFKAMLRQSPIIKREALLAAWVLPLLEIIISIFLFIPYTRKIGLGFSFILMSLFTAYVLYMITFVPKLPCSCGGVISTFTWKQHLYFNLSVTLLAGIGLWLYNRNKLFIAINRTSRTPV